MLEDYRKKRDFKRTAEPAPAIPAAAKGPLNFVVQKHAARQLHYDLRLEFGGTLKSWAVPGGPSTDPQVKRLAIMVEDHPLDYASFEGNIPKGAYGAGQVIVWDNGDYSPDDDGLMSFTNRGEAEKRMKQGLEADKLSFTLRGHKLKGSWTLVKMKRGRNNWLLIKHQDDQANDMNILEKDRSVLSGLTIEEMKAGKEPKAPPANRPGPGNLPGVQPANFPAAPAPMLASSASAPFNGTEWIFEPKLDGYRTIALINGSNVRLLSRNGLDVSRKYAAIIDGLKNQPADRMVLDGEIIALDGKGKSCFQCLQDYLEIMGRKEDGNPEAVAIIYYVFDILYLDGHDLTGGTLDDRKKTLERVILQTNTVRLMEYFEGDGKTVYEAAITQGLEGVVAKRKDSVYHSGQRSPDWIKVKSVTTDEFIIGGYTQGTGNRARTFGALILGSYNSEGRLIPTGNVGSGFDERLLTDLKKRLDYLAIDSSPFYGTPKVNGTPNWVRPELVAEVKYSEQTRDGRLRTPVFLRLRDDKTNEQGRTKFPDTGNKNPDSIPGNPLSNLVSNGAVNDILKQLQSQRENFTIEIEGSQISLTHLDKPMWPGSGKLPPLTKRDLLAYLVRVSPYILKHLRDRPLTMNRYPDGIQGEHFFQKHWGSPVPDFVATVFLSEHKKERHEYILCQNLATLIWLGQVAVLELHSWFSRVTAGSDRSTPDGITNLGEITDSLIDYPDFIVFDIDPYIYSGAEPSGAEPELNREGFRKTCWTALWLKEILEGLSLSSFVKTSGRTGLHIFVPISRQFDYNIVYAAARTICEFMLKKHAKDLTIEWTVNKRRGKIFLDYNQNVRGKTLSSIFSPRPSPEATVSMPLNWTELEKIYPTDFTIENVPEKLAASGDPWAGILSRKHDLKKILELRNNQDQR